MANNARFHEDVFYEYFRPFRHPEVKFDAWGGYGLETFGADLELVRIYDQNFVWTVIDGEFDQWIVSGFHFVNRVCYLLTEVPHRGLHIEFRVARSTRSLTARGLARRLAALHRELLQETQRESTTSRPFNY